MLKESQVRWARHITRMSDAKEPKHLFYGELIEGKQLSSGLKRGFKDSLTPSGTPSIALSC